jgi:hypothetical protein
VAGRRCISGATSSERSPNAPKFDENAFTDPTYRSTVGDYYGSGAGYRDWS